MSWEYFLATKVLYGAFCSVADVIGAASLTVGLSLVRPLRLEGLSTGTALGVDYPSRDYSGFLFIHFHTHLILPWPLLSSIWGRASSSLHTKARRHVP